MNKKKMTNCFVTKNYSQFKKTKGNRPISLSHVAKIKKAIAHKDLKLPIIGLMCIPPQDEESAMHFALLKKIAERNNLRELSMGMSSDFEEAIKFGATSVRIGSLLFGAREI